MFEPKKGDRPVRREEKEREIEGERNLEFGLALDMVVCNTLFQKRSSRLTTFSSGGSNTQIDYIMMKTRDKKHLKDVKVIPSKEVFIQHKLIVSA